ncbi:MAG: UDP-glucose/GDP-mannose dehydrogenase family protein [Holosporaceae bacterium]|jgi:UDPglucose 6-dehydrogenase|nr:UDP-glucose/GDP-mannose dehydrogenase family protein [Holosporaceae bacterium]
MKIAVIGTGYVGLVSGVCFSEFGFNVVCIDNNVAKIAQLDRGDVPIYEPGLDKLMRKNVSARRLSFSTNIAESVASANIVFIAVGTPSNSDGSANLSYVYAVVDEIAEHLGKEVVLVIKSTVPVGTTRSVKKLLGEKGMDVDVAFNPEFLREGAAVDDFMRPDRVILGIEGNRSKKTLMNVYRPLYVFNTPIMFTTLESAELSKYASNAFLAMKVAFINEVADLCESCGADVNDVAIAMGLDKRIGDKFLQAGPGYGGSCFPKDTVALRNFAAKFGAEMSLVNATIRSNQNRRGRMIKKILSACDNEVKGKNISILGVTFKANTDDMRDSPSIEIVNTLANMGANIGIYDPSFSESAKSIFPYVAWNSSVYDNCNGADAIIIITDWTEFRAINFQELKKRVRNPLLIDLRNMYDILDVESSGFRYCCVGRS